MLKALSLLWRSGGHHFRSTEEVDVVEKLNDCTGSGLVITHSNTGCLRGNFTRLALNLKDLPGLTSSSCCFQKDPVCTTWSQPTDFVLLGKDVCKGEADMINNQP